MYLAALVMTHLLLVVIDFHSHNIVCFEDFSCDLKFLYQEQLRRAERKNRDEFRNMLEADIAGGVINAKTSWREYCGKVPSFSLIEN